MRRYALFTDIFRGLHLTVIHGSDISTAHNWQGFVQWVGPIRGVQSVSENPLDTVGCTLRRKKNSRLCSGERR